MRHRLYDTVKAGHACGSLTVWVTASVGWFDSRGMCDDLPRLDWAHSPTCVWWSVFFKWGSVQYKWGWEIIHRRVCSPVMSLSREICQAEQPRGPSVCSLFYTPTGQSDEGAAWLLLWRRMWGKMGGYEDLTPRGCIPITGFSTKTVWCWIQTVRIAKHVCACGTQAGLLSHRDDFRDTVMN